MFWPLSRKSCSSQWLFMHETTKMGFLRWLCNDLDVDCSTFISWRWHIGLKVASKCILDDRLLNWVEVWVHIQPRPQLHLLSEVEKVRVRCEHYESFLTQGLNNGNMLGLKYSSINNTISCPHQRASTKLIIIFSIEWESVCSSKMEGRSTGICHFGSYNAVEIEARWSLPYITSWEIRFHHSLRM